MEPQSMAVVLLRTAWASIVVVGLTGCQGGSGASEHEDSSANQPADSPEKEDSMSIEITSTAFEHGQPIPEKYTGEGLDVSPPLSWSGVPEEAQEWILICDDPDAPSAEPWVHWVLYKIQPNVTSLPEGMPPNTGRKPRQPLTSQFWGNFCFSQPRSRASELETS